MPVPFVWDHTPCEVEDIRSKNICVPFLVKTVLKKKPYYTAAAEQLTSLPDTILGATENHNR